jgi:hypothetical protein
MIERPLTSINQEGEESGPIFEVEEPTDGQVLAYDGDSGKWKNADAGGGGGGALVVTVTYDEGTQTYTCDKTAQEIYDASKAGAVVFDIDYYTVTLLTAYCEEDYGGKFYLYDGYELEGFVTFTAASASDYPTFSVGS